MTESSAQAANGAMVRPASPGSGAAAGAVGPQGGPAGEPERTGPAAGTVTAGPDRPAAEDAGAEPADGLAADPGTDPGSEFDEDSPAGLTRGIWWAAAVLPFLSVAGAILCFAAGVLNTGGCQPEGSALCTGDGQWFTFVLPLLVAPLTAAVTAVCAVVLRKHRSSWLAVGYFVVFVSLLIGLAAANSGSV